MVDANEVKHAHPVRLPTNELVFSSARFRKWCEEVFGPGFSEPQVAERCQVSRNTVHALLYGRRQPTLNTYYRMAAAAGVSLDRWLLRVVYKTGMASQGED